MKHSKQLEESKANSSAAIKELEHLQNEKRKMLMEHETAKLKELDESYSREFTEWKNNLKPRKQVGSYKSVILLFLFTFIMGVKVFLKR